MNNEIQSENSIYILFSCNEWKNTNSMRVVAATTDLDTLHSIVANEIFDGNMDYRGLTENSAFNAFREDYKSGAISLDAVEYGFVLETENVLVDAFGTTEYQEVGELLHMSDEDFSETADCEENDLSEDNEME